MQTRKESLLGIKRNLVLVLKEVVTVTVIDPEIKKTLTEVETEAAVGKSLQVQRRIKNLQKTETETVIAPEVEKELKLGMRTARETGKIDPTNVVGAGTLTRI